MLTFKEIEQEIQKQKALSLQDNYYGYDENQKIQVIIRCLEYNRAIIIENAIIQDICNILNDYSGKKIRPKTIEKINNELNELEFIKDNNLIIRIYTDNNLRITNNLNNFTIYETTLRKNINDLKYNINFAINDLKINSTFKYIENIEQYATECIAKRNKIYNKYDDLIKLVREYNRNNQQILEYIDLNIKEFSY